MVDFLPSATLANAMDGAAQAALAQKPKIHGKNVGAVAQDFESMFLSQMLSPMWSGLEADGMFDGGYAEETFRSMLVNEYGKTLAKTGGLGISNQVKAEMIRMQGGQA
ncbi:MAG: rod-binding protein [Proteobacteria bacterium]|nr:rod-binding protein [Pseudomonadota bacterium]